MKKSKLEKLLSMYIDEKSNELFSKSKSELNIEESIKLDKYIYDLANPEWKPIIINGVKTMYEVSNIGQIINIKSGKMMKSSHNEKGYCQVKLRFNDKGNTRIIHRLVAIVFIPNPENKPQVNHINAKKDINWVGNLEWNTCQENIDHAVKNNLQTHLIGEDSNNSKYTNQQVHNVCKLLEENKLFNIEIAKITGVDVSAVSKIKCRSGWGHISDKYNIPIPLANSVGSSAPASKYSDDQIHKVCKLLYDADRPYKVISGMTGVGLDMIYRINKGKNWKHISSKYIMPTRNLNKPKPKVLSDVSDQVESKLE